MGHPISPGTSLGRVEASGLSAGQDLQEKVQPLKYLLSNHGDRANMCGEAVYLYWGS